jgi:hypothetical protein
MYGTPPGTDFRCQDKSWMDSEVFCEWKRHFISVVKPMPQEKGLLILDGQSTHTLSLATIAVPHKYGMSLFTFTSIFNANLSTISP